MWVPVEYLVIINKLRVMNAVITDGLERLQYFSNLHPSVPNFVHGTHICLSLSGGSPLWLDLYRARGNFQVALYTLKYPCLS